MPRKHRPVVTPEGVRKRKRLGVPESPISLDQLGELLTLQEAAAAGRLHPKTLRRAIKACVNCEKPDVAHGPLGPAGRACPDPSGRMFRAELEAFIPMGRDPGRTGTMGYRIRKDTFMAWLYGKASVSPAPPQ